MGMAHRAPFDQYNKKLGVTDTALDRLRDQLEAAESKLRFESDEHLRNLLDDATVDGFGRNQFEETKDGNDPVFIVDIESHFSIPLKAIVRKALDPKNKVIPGKRNVCTVMPTAYVKEMIAKNRLFGGPRLDKAPVKMSLKDNPTLQSLKDQVTGRVETPIAARTPVVTHTPHAAVPVQGLPPQAAAKQPLAGPNEVKMISWYEKSDDAKPSVMRCEEVLGKDIQRRVFGLLAQGVDADKIAIWRKDHVELSVRI